MTKDIFALQYITGEARGRWDGCAVQYCDTL